MIEFKKTYRDRFRQRGPVVEASAGDHFSATGKNKTEARAALEADIAWYLAQDCTPETRMAPDGSTWVLTVDYAGYSYYIVREAGKFPGSSHMGVRDRQGALDCMLRHMADSYPEDTWPTFLTGLPEPILEETRKEIRRLDKLRAEG